MHQLFRRHDWNLLLLVEAGRILKLIQPLYHGLWPCDHTSFERSGVNQIHPLSPCIMADPGKSSAKEGRNTGKNPRLFGVMLWPCDWGLRASL